MNVFNPKFAAGEKSAPVAGGGVAVQSKSKVA
jgi:hypothetical protein